MHALAIHVSADLATADGAQRWPRAVVAEDTVRRAAQICRRAGIAEQRTLAGRQATHAGLIAALREAVTTMTRDGLLVLTFSGHAVRGTGPIQTTRWCLCDGGVEVWQLADQLARLPPTARLILIVDTCHATAIARCLRGPQLTVVIASCRDDQTMRDRPCSELAVRLERLLCHDERAPSLAEVSRALQADTPDGERPWVWTNVADWWPASALAIFANTA
jgi:hypothetical protein